MSNVSRPYDCYQVFTLCSYLSLQPLNFGYLWKESCDFSCYFTYLLHSNLLWICVKEAALENTDISMVKHAEVPDQKEKETQGTGHSNDALKHSDKDPGCSDNVVSDKTAVAAIGGQVKI